MDVREATNPEQVARFREISRQWRKQLEGGFFYAEGEQVLLRLLDSNLKIVSMLITPQYFDQWKDLIASRDDVEQSIWIAEKKWMEEITAQKLNQGCLALGLVPVAPSLKDLIQQKGGSETRPYKDARVCFVALDGIAHAVN